MKQTVSLYNIITVIAAAGAVLSGCALDSETDLPLKICAVCLAWLLYVTARREVAP